MSYQKVLIIYQFLRPYQKFAITSHSFYNSSTIQHCKEIDGIVYLSSLKGIDINTDALYFPINILNKYINATDGRISRINNVDSASDFGFIRYHHIILGTDSGITPIHNDINDIDSKIISINNTMNGIDCGVIVQNNDLNPIVIL